MLVGKVDEFMLMSHHLSFPKQACRVPACEGHPQAFSQAAQMLLLSSCRCAHLSHVVLRWLHWYLCGHGLQQQFHGQFDRAQSTL